MSSPSSGSVYSVRLKPSTRSARSISVTSVLKPQTYGGPEKHSLRRDRRRSTASVCASRWMMVPTALEINNQDHGDRPQQHDREQHAVGEQQARGTASPLALVHQVE